MHKRLLNMYLKYVAILMVAVLLIGVFPKVIVHAAGSYKDQISDAEDMVTDLEDKKAELKKKLEELEGEKDDILGYIEKLDVELNALSSDIEELNQEIEDVSADLEQTQADLEEAKQTEADQYETMKKRIQYMYENGETNMLEVLLSSENIADLLNQVEYVEQITNYDNDLLGRYTETKDQVEQMTVELEKTLVEKNILNEELLANQDALEELYGKKQGELKKYEKSIDDTKNLSSEYDAQISEQESLIEDLLEKERKRIAEEERKAAEEAARKAEEERKKAEAAQQTQNNSANSNSSNNSSSSNSSVSSSGWMWPVPASSRITCEFGYRTRPTSGASTYHQGIDIGASSGTAIVAAKSGTVVTSSYNVAAGNYIMINHGDGVFTVYMHCSQLLVSAGESVSQGQTIAYVGSTGVSTGPHLHFGVSINGSYVDPSSYVRP